MLLQSVQLLSLTSVCVIKFHSYFILTSYLTKRRILLLLLRGNLMVKEIHVYIINVNNKNKQLLQFLDKQTNGFLQ